MFAWLWWGISAFAGDDHVGANQAIEARFRDLGAAIEAGNPAATMSVLPPAMRAAVARQLGLSEAELQAALATAMTETLAAVKLKRFSADVDRATHHTTPDGSRAYALVPTFVVVKSKDLGTTRVRSHTLAVQDGGEWYLIRVTDAGTVDVLREVYPEFVGVTFPAERVD